MILPVERCSSLLIGSPEQYSSLLIGSHVAHIWSRWYARHAEQKAQAEAKKRQLEEVVIDTVRGDGAGVKIII